MRLVNETKESFDKSREELKPERFAECPCGCVIWLTIDHSSAITMHLYGEQAKEKQ
jgi:hypothetical protein